MYSREPSVAKPPAAFAPPRPPLYAYAGHPSPVITNPGPSKTSPSSVSLSIRRIRSGSVTLNTARLPHNAASRPGASSLVATRPSGAASVIVISSGHGLDLTRGHEQRAVLLRQIHEQPV